MVGCIALLIRFPPETSGFYPWCPVHALTGLWCPGCGATRAVVAFLHGHLAQALALNPLVTLLLPIVMVYFAEVYRRTAFGELTQSVWPRVPRSLVPALLGITAIFTVLRNLS